MSRDHAASFSALTRLLTARFVELGFDSASEPIDTPSPSSLNAATVARYASFRVFLLHCAERPAAQAIRFARTLEGRGERCLVVACTDPDRPFALAAWRVGQRPILREVLPTSLDLFERFRPRRDDSGLTLHFRIVSVLETEPVSSRFFHAFRRTLDVFANKSDWRGSRDDIRVVALTQLTRVLFLYFVQAKGWLNGERDYLRRKFDECLSDRRHFQRTVLIPLMFDVLSSSRSDERFGAVPFLNGGLFERTRLEERVGIPDWSNHLWRRAFDELFDRFGFSVHESEAENTIQPDMLGRVFEELMDPEERKRSGTYFTPHALACRLIDFTLVPLLARRADVSRSCVANLLDGRRPAEPEANRLLEAVRHLTVLDPAVGSGAFLLGVLERISAIYVTLLGPHAIAPHRLRRTILHTNLFGVDTNAVAVRLAELRLWLAVIADDPACDPQSVSPLPNLDGVVRQGDSLFDPLSHVTSYLRAGARVREAALQRVAGVAEARRTLFDTVGQEKRRASTALRSAEFHLARDLFTQHLEIIDAEISRTLNDARTADLFGERRGVENPDRLRHLRAERHQTRREIRHLEQSGNVPFFAFELHCPEILRDGGFDIVIGNPPWVRGERLDRRMRRALTARYQSYRAVGVGFRHLPDLAQAFVERAVELLAPGGVLGFLVPSKLATAGYAAPLRAWLSDRTIIERLWRVDPSDGASFRAAVYPLGLVASKRSQEDSSRESERAAPWVSIGNGERLLRDAVLASPQRVRDRWSLHLGVKTGANDVFLGRIVDSVFRSLTGTESGISPDALRPVLRGRDVRPFAVRSEIHIIWTHAPSGEPYASLPEPLERHLEHHRVRLQTRHDFRGGPYWTLFRTRAAMLCPRVVWPDLSTSLAAAPISAESDLVPLNSCYVALTDSDDDSLALAALLNSSLMRWLARISADEARGHYRRHNARVIGDLPLPPDGAEWTALSAYARDAGKGTSVDHAELDHILAEAFALTKSERARVRQLTPDSR